MIVCLFLQLSFSQVYDKIIFILLALVEYGLLPQTAYYAIKRGKYSEQLVIDNYTYIWTQQIIVDNSLLSWT